MIGLRKPRRRAARSTDHAGAAHDRAARRPIEPTASAASVPPLTPKERMAIDRVSRCPSRTPTSARTTSARSTSGLTEKLAMLEAERCLQCKKPDVHRRLPGARQHPALHRPPARAATCAAAADSLLDDNALPCVTGRVCPQESSARASACAARRASRSRSATSSASSPTGRRRIRDEPLARRGRQPSGKTVAVVGSGPAGLTAAGELAKRGHDVTIFEAFHAAGRRAHLRHPRVPPAQGHRPATRSTGCVEAGRQDRAQRDHRQDLHARRAARAVRRRVHRRRRRPAGLHGRARREPQGRLLGQRVPDPRQPDGRLATRTPTRRSCTASASSSSAAATSPWTPSARPRGWAPRRPSSSTAAAHDEMPARAEEVHHAEQEGIRFEFLVAPVEVLGDETAGSPACGAAHGARRARRLRPRAGPSPIPGSEFVIACDMVVVAIGTRSNPLLTATTPDLDGQRVGLHRRPTSTA